MDQSKVYFTDFRTYHGESLLHKMERLIKMAGIEQIDFEDKFVAVKMHFGEPGNLSFIRPNYAKVICDLVKAKGGKPFLTDCNTLYVGGRKNAIDHLKAAQENGFSPLTTGVPVIIADGLHGFDERLVPIPFENSYVKEAKIGAAIMDADIVISLTHFKGHVSAGFGGTIKNIGMGCGSHAGKMEMHTEGTPRVSRKRCVGCGTCVRNCAHEGIKVEDGLAVIQEDKCKGCGRCIAVCPKGALHNKFDIAKDVLNYKMAEYSWAVLHDRPSFHITLVQDVSPDCDCEGHNDLPIVPDVGMFAGFDPIALDQACVDAVNRQPIVEESLLGEIARGEKEEEGFKKIMLESGDGLDYFKMGHPITHWQSCLEYGEKIGLGTRNYEIVRMK